MLLQAICFLQFMFNSVVFNITIQHDTARQTKKIHFRLKISYNKKKKNSRVVICFIFKDIMPFFAFL